MADGTRGLRRELVTPEGVTLHLTLGSGGARAGAFLLDLIVILLILVGFTLLIMLVAAAIGRTLGSLILVTWMLGFFALRNFYFVLHEAGARGATPGKRIMRLRVVTRDGGRLSGTAVLARNLMREIEIFLPLMFLGVSASEGTVDRWIGILGFAWAAIFLFFPLMNRDRLRAGDLVAGTRVVMNERRRIGEDLLTPLSSPAASGVIAPFSPAELAAYGQYELQRLEEVLRRGDKDDIWTVAATIRRRIGRDDEYHELAFLEAYYAALRLDLERKLLFGRRKRDKHDIAG